MAFVVSLPHAADFTQSLALQIIFAREFLKEVRMKDDQVKYLVTNARNGMCQGHRAELFAVRAAKACAALAVSALFKSRVRRMFLQVYEQCCQSSSAVCCPCGECSVKPHSRVLFWQIPIRSAQ